MRPFLAVLVVTCSLTAIGCGDDSSSDTLSTADLKAKASAICKKVVAAQQKAASSNDGDAIKTAGADAIGELEALKPSDADKAKFEAYVTAQKAAVAATDPIADALTAKDQAKVQELATASQPIVDKANAAAAAAGLPDCGA